MRPLTKKDRENITQSEAQRIDSVIAGTTVVANMCNDKTLIKWAKRNDIFVPIDKSTSYWNRFTVKEYGRHGSIGFYKDNLLALEHEVIGDCCGGRPPLIWAAIKSGVFTDKVLGCWCLPEPCHGGVIAEIVNDRYGGNPQQPTQLTLF